MKKSTVTQRQIEALRLHKSFHADCEKARGRFLLTAKFEKGKLVVWNDKSLREETWGILEQYSTLPESWKPSIENYLKTGIMTPPKSATEPIVTLDIFKPNNRFELNVRVFKHTTKREYIKAWKKIVNMRKDLSEFNPSVISKADEVIVDLYIKGKTTREICDYLSDHSEEIYGKDRNGDVPQEDTVRSRLKTLRRNLGVNKKS